MDQDRWDRLAQALKDAGFEGRLDRKPYTEQYRGRVRSGLSCSITITVPGKGLITVSDKYYAKNLDVWLGWTVCAEGLDSITRGRDSYAIKNRSSVVNDVRAAVKRLGA